MTSDRGQRGDAEMQLGNNPVTHKTLNPNADVFQVTKSPAASPDSTADSWQGSEVDTVINVASPESPEAQGFTYMNGDASSTKLSPVVIYPPTPESPQLQVTEFQNLNGGINSEILFPGNDVGQSDENGPFDPNIPEDQLRAMLKNQLEYYFSRENLSHDSYLVSQMDPDQFVPIATIAGFNQVKRLTSNMDLVVEVLRDSTNVQVDENGEKVRPLHKRCIVILREVPESTPVEDVKKLFSGQNCPKFLTCEYAANNNWYVTFDSDEDAQRAYQYLREDVKNFLGKPIMARIKAKPNLYNSTFVPKNGFKATGNMAQFPVSPGAAAAAPQSVAGSQGGAETGQTPPGPFPQPQPQSQPQAQQQPQTQPISQHGYTFTTQQVPSIQYIRNQNFPFFPPNAVMHPWPTSLQFFDPGTAFAANGYTPSSLKISGNTNRHGFQNMRNRNQKQGHMRGPPSHDRDSISTHNSRPPPPPRLANAHYHHNSHHQSSEHPQSNVHRSSPRNSDSFHGNVMRSDSSHGNSHTSHSVSHSSVLHSQNSLDNGSGPIHSSGRQSDPAGSKDQNSQSSSRRPGYPGSNYKSRRRVHDDGAKTSRNASQTSAKESKHVESPKFELEATSFPPLPGSTNNTTTGDIFENKMSDVVKGTAKPSTRDTKTQTQPPSPASPSKEKEKNAAANGASTLPTPPPTPQKASKSTSTETTVPVSSSSSKPEPSPAPVASMTTTSTQTTSAQTTQAKVRAPQQPVRQPSEEKEKEKVVSTSSSGAIPPVKLSYAQMAQRGKSGPGIGGATTADTPSATASQQTSAVPAAKESAASNSNTSNKPQTLKEQSQQTVSRRSPTSNENFRKDSTKEEPRESRVVGGRKAKENRDRITEKDRKERDNERPKERRRDRDLDQNVRPNQK